MKFLKTLYSKIALLKAAYNYTNCAYIHLDVDEQYYYVSLTPKEDGRPVSESEFANEMLAQSVRHEIYLQTKNVRELLVARAMSTSLISKQNAVAVENDKDELFSEDEILKDWFADDGKSDS